MKTEKTTVIDLTTDTGANVLAWINHAGQVFAKGRTRKGGRWVAVLDSVYPPGQPCSPSATELVLGRAIDALAHVATGTEENDAPLEAIRTGLAALISDRATAGKGDIRIESAHAVAKALRGSIVERFDVRVETTVTTRNVNIANGIVAFESGEATHEETVALFQRLLDTGTIHHLQGSYQRTMQALIDAGEVTVTSDSDPATGIEYGTAS